MITPRKPQSDGFDDVDFLDPQGVVSTTDCTGLIPTPPLDDDEADSYKDIYAIPEQGKLADVEENIAQQLRD